MRPSISIGSSFMDSKLGLDLLDKWPGPASRPEKADSQSKESGARGTRAPQMQTADLVAVPSASAAAAAVFATTTATAGRALFAWFGLVDGEIAPVKGCTVHRRNRLLRLFGRTHGDESKAARAARGPVHHEVGFEDGAVRGERVLKVVFGDIEGKVSYKQFLIHMMLLLTRLTVAFPRLFPMIGFQIITEPSSL